MSEIRKPLTRARILEAAVALVDDEGLDALTMRRLGQRLKVEAMSLYRHVDGRAALLDGIHEMILAELEEPPKAKAWTTAVRQLARAFRKVLVAHPNALPIFATRPAVTPASLRHVDRGLRILRGAGFSVDEAISGFQVVVSFVVGHALWTHGQTDSEEHAAPVYDVEGLDALAEAAPALANHDLEAEFELGLDVLVRGLESRASRG
jgi:TetR/AcrR family tetracycline transcriptional repressor